MPLNNPAAYGLEPFNAANTLALGENIRGARTQNALAQLQLQREQDPNSLINQRRELQTNAAAETLRSAQLQNAVPALSSARQMLSSVRETIENKGAVAGRQMLNRQLFTLKNQGILPEDFDLGVDPGALSDEEFTQDVFQSEQDLTGMLSSLVPDDTQARVSADIGDMQALGMELTPENFREFQSMKGRSGDEIEALIQEARLTGLLREERQAREDQETQRIAARQQIQRNLAQNQTAVDLTQRLQGTVLEAGSVFPADLRRGLADLQRLTSRLTGDDASELSRVIADFDTQRKILEDQVNSRIASGDYGRSATQLESIQRSLASPDISPAAIIRIQGQLAEIDLDRAEADNLDVENREEWERRADEWKNYDPITDSIPNMNLGQLRQLDIDTLSDEQAEAALRRLDELQ